MNDNVPHSKTKVIITYISLFIFIIISFYISWLYWTFRFILSLIIYSFIFYTIHYIWKKISKKEIMLFSNFINYFIWRAVLLLVFIIWFFSIMTYLSNEKYPAPMPEYTITNWTKIITFQAMSHIWTRNFYDEVIKNITEHKKKWWVYFYEWVKPGSEKSLDKFNQAIWVEFDENLYENFSKLYWVINQDNREFIWLVNELDFNVDLNMDQIVTLYDEKISTKTNSWEVYENKIPIDANKIIIDALSELNEKELKILVYVNQAILNFIIWSESTQEFLTENFSNTDLFDVILDKRNELLTSTIIESEYNNIYITYWLLHFNWVLKLLQDNDTNWKIISTKNLYPIKN